MLLEMNSVSSQWNLRRGNASGRHSMPFNAVSRTCGLIMGLKGVSLGSCGPAGVFLQNAMIYILDFEILQGKAWLCRQDAKRENLLVLALLEKLELPVPKHRTLYAEISRVLGLLIEEDTIFVPPNTRNPIATDLTISWIQETPSISSPSKFHTEDQVSSTFSSSPGDNLAPLRS